MGSWTRTQWSMISVPEREERDRSQTGRYMLRRIQTFGVEHEPRTVGLGPRDHGNGVVSCGIVALDHVSRIGGRRLDVEDLAGGDVGPLDFIVGDLLPQKCERIASETGTLDHESPIAAKAVSMGGIRRWNSACSARRAAVKTEM